MMVLQQVLGIGLVIVALLTMLTGSIGIIRLPDFFSRTHAASLVDTVGIIFMLLGFAVLEGWTLTSGKLLLAGVFIAMTNPVTVHALGWAALQVGRRPWKARRKQRNR
jgi:multicomponent Na+:H+ antiporter subunit G